MMDLSSPSEPTQVISMLGQYRSQLRHSSSGSRLSMSNLNNTGQQEKKINKNLKLKVFRVSQKRD